jgi:hypothetical protein
VFNSADGFQCEAVGQHAVLQSGSFTALARISTSSQCTAFHYTKFASSDFCVALSIPALSLPRKRESMRCAIWHCVMDSRFRGNDRDSLVLQLSGMECI